MQIRLTVLASRGGRAASRPCDVVVTAPASTVLVTVLDGLADAAAGASSGRDATDDRADRHDRTAHETVPAYAGTRRLDPQRQLVGAPPLVDGAEISLYGPAPTAPADPYGPARARLHVVAGPDAGGVHLLHGGRVTLGRSADADVPLDDPDVSRLHCAVTVTDSGELTVTDLESTNGTTVDDVPVSGGRTAPLPAGATLHLGESAARVSTAVSQPPDAALPTTPDGEGHLRISLDDAPSPTAGDGSAGPVPPTPAPPPPAQAPRPEWPAPPPAGPPPPRRPVLGTTSATGRHGGEAPHDRTGRHDDTVPHDHTVFGAGESSLTTHPGSATVRDRGWSTWARRLAAWRDAASGDTATDHPTGPHHRGTRPAADATAWDALRPDPATVLLTALGPGPRLWERGPDHPEALTVRLGSAHRSNGRGEPVTVDLPRTGSLGLAGPRARLAALARYVLAQAAALHAPGSLEIVLLAADSSRDAADRTAEWGWLGWLPHLRPAHGQDCRLLVAYDRDQAAARTTELTRRLDETPHAATPYTGPRTLLVVDGDPGPATVREAVSRIASEGASAGVHVLCLAETPSATPASPLDATVRAAGEASAPFRACATYALLSGAVATAVRIVRPGHHHADSTVATMDGVSAAWAERFARALAPLREAEGTSATAPPAPRASISLPRTCRLLDELGLARATPNAILARWAADGPRPVAPFTLGAGTRGPAGAAFSAEHGHLRLTGPVGAGKTELLRALAASLAAGTQPDRLALALLDGDPDALRDGGLGSCADLPHLASHLVAGDPTRMRDFAQSLSAELKRRAELLGDRTFQDATRVVSPRRPEDSSAPLRRMVVLVDDFDTLVDPALGNPGRPSAGSVVRALEAVARDGARLGVHLVTASGRPDRTADTTAARKAAFHIHLTGRDGDNPAPGRGTLRLPDGTTTDFQTGRVTGRIPRTSTLRPTVVPLDWARAGDPPTRRPVRELGNGPTDLALLASALTRAARTTSSTQPSTTPRHLPTT